MLSGIHNLFPKCSASTTSAYRIELIFIKHIPVHKMDTYLILGSEEKEIELYGAVIMEKTGSVGYCSC